MNRREFLILGSVGTAASLAGCNSPLTTDNNNQEVTSQNTDTPSLTESDNIIAEFEGNESTTTNTFSVENVPGITIEVGYSDLTDFTAHLLFPSEDMEDVLIVKTAMSTSGEFYFQPEHDEMQIAVSIPDAGESESWNMKVRKDEITLVDDE